jgi:hypothetical protein
MLRDVVAVTPIRAYRVRVAFDDGVTGEVDISQVVPFEGVFAPLRDLAYFRQVAIHPELATLVWPNGADIDSDVLYHELTGAPLPATQVA